MADDNSGASPIASGGISATNPLFISNKTFGRLQCMKDDYAPPPQARHEVKAWDGKERASPGEELLKKLNGGLDPVYGNTFHYQAALSTQDAAIGEGIGAALGKILQFGGRLIGSARNAIRPPAPKPEPAAPKPASAGDGVYVEKPPKPAPGSAEHKADRWKKYQERGGKKSYEEWSKQYDTNMRNYQYGSAREAEYRAAMDAGEGTVKTPLTNRQIDILKEEELYAGQLKTGPVSLTQENALAIQKDATLVKEGWTVEHILEKGASKPYLDALDKAGIQYKIGPQIP